MTYLSTVCVQGTDINILSPCHFYWVSKSLIPCPQYFDVGAAFYCIFDCSFSTWKWSVFKLGLWPGYFESRTSGLGLSDLSSSCFIVPSHSTSLRGGRSIFIHHDNPDQGSNSIICCSESRILFLSQMGKSHTCVLCGNIIHEQMG